MRFRNTFTEEFFGVNGTVTEVTRETSIMSPVPSTTVSTAPLSGSQYLPASTTATSALTAPLSSPTQSTPTAVSALSSQPLTLADLATIQNLTKPQVLVDYRPLPIASAPIPVPTTGSPTTGGFGGGYGGGSAPEEEVVEDRMAEAEVDGSGGGITGTDNKAKLKKIFMWILIAIAIYMVWKYSQKK